jgi:glycosyltransferase involved in cell wall biosynthesis
MSSVLQPKRLRVAIAGETIGGGNGLTNYLSCLNSALLEQADAQHEISCFGIATETTSLGMARTAARRSLSGSWLKPLLRPLYRVAVGHRPFPAAAKWTRAWRALPTDVVCVVPHVVGHDGGRLDAYYAAITARRLLWVVHDLHPFHFPEQWEGRTCARLIQRCRMLAKHASAIVVHNDFTKADVCARLGVRPEVVRIARLPSILPAAPAAEVSATSNPLLPFGDYRCPYALWASSSTFPHKNHDNLLLAWRQLLDRGHELTLVCTGDKGPRWRELSARIDALGLNQRVLFTGSVPLEVLRGILLGARLAVCPTLFEGGGSGPAAEAMMAGIPVACSDIPQLKEQFDGRSDLCAWFDARSPQAITTAVEGILLDFPAAQARATQARSVYAGLRSWSEVARVYLSAMDAC